MKDKVLEPTKKQQKELDNLMKDKTDLSKKVVKDYVDNPSTTELTNTELYDGTSWTASAAMNTARRGHGGAGSTNASALAFAGYTGSDTAATEQFTGAGVTTKTITSS